MLKMRLLLLGVGLLVAACDKTVDPPPAPPCHPPPPGDSAPVAGAPTPRLESPIQKVYAPRELQQSPSLSAGESGRGELPTPLEQPGQMTLI
jgi:hypothetical protein